MTAVVVELPRRGRAPRRMLSDLGVEDTKQILRIHSRPDVRNDVVVCHHVPGGVHGEDFFGQIRSACGGSYWTVGLTTFETDRIPATWIDPCNRMDEIWVPTEFNRVTFAACGVDPSKIRVMPFGVEPLKEGDTDVSCVVRSTKSFKFLSVFELTKRKGWDVLLRAWCDAFRPEDDVALVVKTYGRGTTNPIEVFSRHLREIGLDPENIPEIVLIDERLTDTGMRGLYAQCDAFVLPSRGEGWGMPYLEAQRQGLPVVATRWSGQLQFLNDSNAFLVDIEGTTPVDAEQVRDDPIYAGHRWAEPSAASLTEAFRRVHEDADERRRRAAQGASDAATIWTAEAAASRFTARLREIETGRRAVIRSFGPSVQTPADVEWCGPLYSPSGYGSEARSFVKLLDASGVAVRIKPMSWDAAVAEIGRSETERLHALALRPAAERRVVVRHLFPEHATRGDEAVCVVRTMFETDRLPEAWPKLLEDADEIWVPSRHNLATFAACGVPRAKLALVPGTIDMGAYAPNGPAAALAAENVFVFLSVFEWSPRKAPNVLLQAYIERFLGRDDVLLALRASPPPGYRPADLVGGLKRIVDRVTPKGGVAPPIHLLPSLADADLPALYRGADAFVLPTRGEGFGRPFLEAAAVGLPVIATRYGGHLDFLTEANSYLVDARMIDVDAASAAIIKKAAGHRWADPDVASLKARMLEVYSDRSAAARCGARAAADVRRTHGPERVGRILRDRLDRLRARL